MTRVQSAYFAAFVCAVLLCLSPSKAAGYVAPAAVIAVFLFRSGSAWCFRRLVWFYSLFALYIFVFILINREFRFQNALVALLTYSGILAIVVIPSRGLAGSILTDKVLKVATVTLLIEAAVGIVQAGVRFYTSGSFDSTNGDYVQGTIHLSFEPDYAFANPMFALNVAMLILFVWSAKPKASRSRLVMIGLGLSVLILASVLHLTLMSLVAVFLGSLYGLTGKKALRRLGQVIVFLVIAVVALAVLMPKNLASVRQYWDSIATRRSIRVQMVERALVDMPAVYPQLPLIGLGLGQFNSRAAMICTGRYFGGNAAQSAFYSLPVTEMSSAQDSYFRDLWEANMHDTSYSSTVKPFFSWLSVYTELGGVGVIAVIAVFWIILQKIWANRWKNPRLAIAVASGTMLYAFLGAQENYWEVPQAILIGLMLLKLLYANLLAGAPRRSPLAGSTLRRAIPQVNAAASLSRRPVPSLATRS